MGNFRFKEFTVRHDRSTMKVGTDGVLLGAAVEPHNANNILDAGTGCGVIALVLAQRFQAEITAIDIDKDSIEEAALNFEKSPWSTRLYPVHETMQEHSQKWSDFYDMIVSNPPFFQNSLKTPGVGRNKARHNDTLPYRDMISSASRMLKEEGVLWIILPVTESHTFLSIAKEYKLFLSNELLIKPKKERDPNRRIMKLCPGNTAIRYTSESIAIRTENNEFTRDYKKFTSDYYLHF